MTTPCIVSGVKAFNVVESNWTSTVDAYTPNRTKPRYPVLSATANNEENRADLNWHGFPGQSSVVDSTYCG